MNARMHFSGCVLLAVVLLPGVSAAGTVTETSSWEEIYTDVGDKPRLLISNIWGDVTVRAGAPGQIRVAVSKRVSAPDDRLLALALERFAIDVETSSSELALVVGDSYEQRGRKNRCRRCRADYDFDIVVPAGTDIDVGTVNDGTVDIADITGPVRAHNVNGSVQIKRIAHCEYVESVNGDVDVEFGQTPDAACRIETVNGDIGIRIPEAGGLDLAVDLFNGRIRSEFDVAPLAIPAVVETTAGDSGQHYRISQAAGVRVGPGGKLFTISSINGDVTIGKSP